MNSHNRNLPTLSTLQISPRMNSHNQYLPNLSTLQISPQPPHHSPTITSLRHYHPAPLPPHSSITSSNLSSPHVAPSTTHQTQPTVPLHANAPVQRRSAHKSARQTSNKIQQELDRHAALSAAEVTARTNDIISSYEFEGHNFFTHPTGSREKLRIWIHNLDGISAQQPNSLIDDMILIAQAQVDIIIWQDPLISDDTRRTILPLIKTHWGGDTMEDKLWTGPRSMPKEMNHGVWVLVHSRWSQRIQEWITDPTGWARFGGVVLTGTKKSKNDRPQSLGIVSTYSAPRDSAAWNWLAKTMKTKMSNGVRDRLACDLSAVRAKYAQKHVQLAFMGDFNAVWNPASRHRNASLTFRQKAHARFWKKWSYTNELINAKDTILPRAYTLLQKFVPR